MRDVQISRLAIEATNIRNANGPVHAVFSVGDYDSQRRIIDDKRQPLIKN